MSQTLLIATSNVRFAAAMATRVMVIDQGRIVADGPAESILYDQDLMNMHGLETP
jgi:cobalt/nickel transport system ATP-binding protein